MQNNKDNISKHEGNKDKKEITCRCEAPDERRTIKFNLKDYRSPAFILEKINKKIEEQEEKDKSIKEKIKRQFFAVLL